MSVSFSLDAEIHETYSTPSQTTAQREIGHPTQFDATWAIFYHFFLNKSARNLLRQVCIELVSLSESHETWAAGPYGFVEFCDDQTLAELRRHWTLYIQAIDDTKISTMLEKKMRDGMKEIRSNGEGNRSLGILRSSGVAEVLAAQSRLDDTYWTHGTTFTKNGNITNARYVNPTFSYSLAGTDFSVHYGTHPLIAFHLAPAFLQDTKHKPVMPTLANVVSVAHTELREWGTSFRNIVQSKRLFIQFFAGDALSFCSTLKVFHQSGVLDAGEHTLRWSPSMIKLNTRVYDPERHSSTLFDVIDTSNLVDHMGFMNVLICARPLLSHTCDAVLFTESLHPNGNDPTTGFLSHLCGDAFTLSLLLGVIPIDMVGGLTSYSNRHEVLLAASSHFSPGQYRERAAWRRPDRMQGGSHPLAALDFDPKQLASLLFSIYSLMFASESPRNMFQNLSLSSIIKAGLVHYVRGTFSGLLCLVCARVKPSTRTQAIDLLLDHICQDRDIPMGMNYFQDLVCHIYRSRLWDSQDVHVNLNPSNDYFRLFHGWSCVPPTAKVILRVPRSSLTVIAAAENVGTPVLVANTNGAFGSNAIFSSLNAFFGEVTFDGQGEHRVAVFTPDKAGLQGTSDLIVSFHILNDLLMGSPPRLMSVSLAICATPSVTRAFVGKLGLELHLFTAKVTDKSHVNVIKDTRPPEIPTQRLSADTSFTIQLDESAKPLIKSLTSRVVISNPATHQSLLAGAAVEHTQSAPVDTVLRFASSKFPIHWPLLVDSSEQKIRIARKSGWIEVALPPAALDLKVKNQSLQNITPICVEDGHRLAWNIHYVNLDIMPTFTLQTPFHNPLNFHMGLQMSDREKNLEQDSKDVMREIKLSIAHIFKHLTESSSPTFPVFIFRDHKKRQRHIVFITSLRLDLSSHTVVAYAYLTTLTNEVNRVMNQIAQRLPPRAGGFITLTIDLEGEVQAWHYLFPAFAERCRTWKHQCSPNISTASAGSVDNITDPLCQCGRGKNIDEFVTRYPAFKDLAPYLTRIALSPIFAVSYLEKVISKNPTAPRSPALSSQGPGAGARTLGIARPHVRRKIGKHISHGALNSP
ncbi:hypothetical protein ONZ45_g7902 [Pleurotus djamor]|nr:hypothetical protein ONZ45_g7902 [Pleurotus djamor]